MRAASAEWAVSSFKGVMVRGAAGSLGLTALLLAILGPCWTSWIADGILVAECPAGEPRPVVEATVRGLERGRPGQLEIEAAASYFSPRWREERRSPLRRLDASLQLRVGEALLPVRCADWEAPYAGALRCDRVELPPDVPDGDHTLLVAVDTPLDEDPVVEVPLPLYAPAALHVLTDRPLYEPGQTILFRSLSLSRADGVPLEDRPGTWEVLDPRGAVLLEERSPGGAWGVAASSFPLARDAAAGTWTVRWRSGRDAAEARVQVRPFTLPRFQVEAEAEAPWYGEGDSPRVRGLATYASGAPVGGAEVAVRWSGSPEWPPPREWLEERRLRADEDGAFLIELPPVPADLPAPGLTSLSAEIAVTDEAGEVVRAGARVLLSRDPLRVEGVTEIGDGLVGGYPNRVYLRVSTPDGRALADRQVTVRRAWDPRDPGERATSDADGVIALLIDPGEPVNLATPPPPWRPPPPSETRSFRAGGATQLLDLPPAGLAEARSADRLGDRLERDCAHLIDGGGELEQVIRVRGGRVAEVAPTETALQACAARSVEGLAFEGRGLYRLDWRLSAPAIPSLILSHQVSPPAGVARALAAAAADARQCLSGYTERYLERGAPRLDTGWSVIWSVSAGSRRLRTEPWGGRGELPGMACLQASFRGLSTEAEAERDALGATRLDLSVPLPEEAPRRLPTLSPGYELAVAVEGVGESTWRSAPGHIPDVRLRPSAVVTEAGEPFEVEILRGPGFRGALPESLRLMRGEDVIQVYELPDDSRVARFDPPEEASGFLSVQWAGARAIVYARPAGALSLELSTPADSYRPGDRLSLSVRTSAPAVVSLVGVDGRLGQLAPLRGPGDLGEALVSASSAEPAFGRFDAVALAAGAVRGENAARAAVLRVSELAPASALSPVQSFSASATYDPDEELARVFYGLLPQVRAAVRAWEAAAPAGEVLSNARMAALFEAGLKSAAAAGLPTEDPWGERLRLERLPDALLARVDPRALSGDGARLPEDVVDWARWVDEELRR